MMIDGLQCGHFDRASLEDLKSGDISAVTVTCGFWEGTVESLDSLGKWRDFARENADIAAIATSADDITRAAKAGKTALIMGYQNTNCLEGRIRLVEMFAELGVRVLQLTYNNQNELAGSCYEAEDSGLARFGREVITEMNSTGILVDLSHVGNRSTLHAIKHSKKPVAVTHANAESLFAHKRNKTDDVLKALADNGGVIGCAAYRNITGDYFCSTVDAWCEMVVRTVEIAGIDHVAIGTDRSHNFTKLDYDWMRKGRWTRGVDYGAGSAANPGKAPPPDWFKTFADLKLIAPALLRKGVSQADVDKITHGNWMRIYRDVFRG